MEDLYKEEQFYKDEGWPTESFCYCSYIFYTGEETIYGLDYDQFALVENAEYPYIRLTKKRERCHIPCGGSSQPATDGWFSKLSESERDGQCPKIAWGFAAVFLANLFYDRDQRDYVEQKDRNGLMKDYYGKYFKRYLDCHNGLKYSKITIEQKELDFLTEHETLIRVLWEKSSPLEKYPQLFDYANEAETDYENFLHKRKSEIEKKKEGEEGSIPTETSGKRVVIQNGEKSVYIEENNGNVTIT